MLKKLIAIIFLTIYLFNLGGYSLAFRYFMALSEQEFVAQINEKNYDDADLIEIVIPLNLPYMQNSAGFERVDGSVEKDGVNYNYVKRRIHSDTLYVLCLPNNERTRLLKQKTKYSARVNDFEIAKKEKKSSTKKVVNASEYSCYNDIAQHLLMLPGSNAKKQNTFFAVHLSSTTLAKPERPPQAF